MRSELLQVVRAPHDLPSRPNGMGRASGMRGLTLIELLTVIAVLGILSTIAFASYRSYLVRTNRTDASTSLLRIQVAEEKFFLQNNTYTTDVKGALGFGATTTPRGNYDLSVAAGASGAIGTSFTATATASGGQAGDDAKCQKLMIDDRGMRGSTPGATSECWR
jgi:type IV pilus assembly protein PilE